MAHCDHKIRTDKHHPNHENKYHHLRAWEDKIPIHIYYLFDKVFLFPDTDDFLPNLEVFVL